VFGSLPARKDTATWTVRDVEPALESLRPAHRKMPRDVGPGEGCSAELAGCLGTTRARSALASAKTVIPGQMPPATGAAASDSGKLALII
jgi:hypothetical protein